MRPRKHDVGNRYGNRVILEYPFKSKDVLVRCDCGREDWVRISNLTQGTANKCRDCTKQDPIFKTYAAFARTAKRRGLAVEISMKDWVDISCKSCGYCGATPSNCSYGYLYNGIDRIDSSKGYISGNMRPACIICNRAKSKMTEQEFYDWIRSVYHSTASVPI